jgi:NAD(P)-dependent dehydrogenase (short-subunit alcohol dehydrogenase family)
VGALRDLDGRSAVPKAIRVGRAEEVAAAVVFLASGQAGSITRAMLGVNGGLLMR